MSTPPALANGRILAGTLIDPENNFTFEVWAYRLISEAELASAYRVWSQQRDRRRSLKNKRIQVIAGFGMGQGI